MLRESDFLWPPRRRSGLIRWSQVEAGPRREGLPGYLQRLTGFAAWAGLCFLVLGACVSPSQAAGEITLYYVGAVSRAEFDALPSYCQKLASNSSNVLPPLNLTTQETDSLRGIGGYHHFCRIPVLRMRHLKERDGYKKSFLLDLIIDEANYVAGHAQPDAPLLGVAYLERARAQVDKNLIAKAIPDYYNALHVNPKMTAAYLDLARMFERLNDKAKALDIITEGLRQSPSKSLKRRYLELGGKEPYPEPHPDKATPAVEAATPALLPSSPPESRATLPPPEQKTTETASPAKSANPPEGASKSSPPEGTRPGQEGDKRFCRFCPEP